MTDTSTMDVGDIAVELIELEASISEACAWTGKYIARKDQLTDELNKRREQSRVSGKARVRA